MTGTQEVSPEVISRLLEAATEARNNAYAPYSHFRVGAAIMTHSGTMYTGCNVESISYTPTICAERVAFGTAIAAGEKPGNFSAVAIVADDPEPSTPCGVCRQVMSELAPGALVVMRAAPEKGDGLLQLTIEELLPYSFAFHEEKAK